MTIEKYRKPAHMIKNFNCPHCGHYATQEWKRWEPKLTTAQCNICKEHSIWRGGYLVYPLTSSVPKAKNNMPDDVKELYEEARQVHVYSPRAAAVLLRVATERLTVYLGETEGKLNTRIKNLETKERLDPIIIRSLHILRVTGNEGAHDGLLKLTGAEGAKAVDNLFFAINYLVEKIITDPARINKIYGELPPNKLDGIKNRAKPKDKK